MTITLDLPPDLEARFAAEDKTKGLPVDEVVTAHLYRTPPLRASGQPSAMDVEKWLDQAAALIPECIPPLSDDWNR